MDLSNSANPFLQSFPRTNEIVEPRLSQVTALEIMWHHVKAKIKKIRLVMPPGGGKSAVAVAIMQAYLKTDVNTLYCSPLNILVNQIQKKFKITTLKGRKHYPCLAGRNNAAEGYCQTDDCLHEMCGLSGNCDECIYNETKSEFVSSKIANTNFSLFQIGIDNHPYAVIIDEADEVENFIRLSHTVTIPDVSWDFADFKDHIKFLKECWEQNKKILIEAKSDMNLKDRLDLIRSSNRIEYLITDYTTYKEPWAVRVKVREDKSDRSWTKYQPVTINRFLDQLFSDRMVVCMSATPPNWEGFCTVQVESEFPKEIRPWKWHPVGRMSLNYRNKNIPKVAHFLRRLSGKTLVHCVSYDTASDLAKALKSIGIHPLLQVRTVSETEEDYEKDSVKRDEAAEVFVASKDQNKILLSVKFDRGVDFYEPDIVNNVIACVPWPNPKDPLTIAKNKYMGTAWQDEQVAATIMQMYGRVNRNMKKRTMTTILDSNFNSYVKNYWYSNHKDLFFDWFTEAEVKNGIAPSKMAVK